jgi:hypothetical protein
MTTIAEATKRVRAEYLQAPALHLKAEQVQRLCGIEPIMCQLALDSLVAAMFLRLTSHGRYARAAEGCASVSEIGDGFGNQSANPAPHVTQSDDPRGEAGTLILRQPERRRHRLRRVY